MAKRPGKIIYCKLTYIKIIPKQPIPCGECIGEIMEGHGNPLIAEYFATAIVEEAGISHLDELKQIIAEKYDISIESQK